MASEKVWKDIYSYQMTPEEIIAKVTEICHQHGVAHLLLFGSYAEGNPTRTSDIDFVVKGCKDFLSLDDAVQRIPTLMKIDLFDYDHISNENLRKDISQYAKEIY